MKKRYICELCGYEYNPAEGDPENGIAPGTDFEDLPEDWVCPLCGASKEDFTIEEVEEAEEQKHKNSPFRNLCGTGNFCL